MTILQTTTLTKWYLEHETDRRETFQLRAAHLGASPVPSMILQVDQLHSRDGLSLKLLETEAVEILGRYRPCRTHRKWHRKGNVHEVVTHELDVAGVAGSAPVGAG